MLHKKIPLYFVFLILFFSLSSFYFALKYTSLSTKPESDFVQNDSNLNSICNLNISRLNGYQFVHPLLFAEPACESEELLNCKNQINQVINANKTLGTISSASVYIREFSQAQWISINDGEYYSPGSLLKVPELIAFYKMNERTPGLLDKEILYNSNINNSKRILTFESKHIELGKKYKVRDLLYYMIVYSDNDATMLLNSMIDKNVFSKVFSDIGMKEPDYSSSDYQMTAKTYSTFFKELYNGSYLSFKDSEECLNMLSKSDFKEGMLSGLPSSCLSSHKFGEGGVNSTPNFSESAIVYCGRTPFILTIMLKGTEMKKLPKVSGEISKKVYDFMSQRS